MRKLLYLLPLLASVSHAAVIFNPRIGIKNTNTLQSGATFYVSSGTVQTMNIGTSVTWPDGTVQVSSPSAGGGMSIGGAVTGGTANSVLYLDGSSLLAETNPGFTWGSKVMTIEGDIVLGGSTSGTGDLTMDGSTTDGGYIPILFRNNKVAAVTNNTGIHWYFKDSNQALADFLELRVTSADKTFNSKDVRINLYAQVANNGRDILSFDGTTGELVLNDDGIDLDFRVEASGQPNALFVRGSDGNVSLGTLTVDDADSVQNIQIDHSALPRSGGIGPQVVDSQIYAQSFIDSGAAGYFLIATSTQSAFDTSNPVAYMQLSGDAASPSVIFVSDPGSGAQTILGVYPTYASVNNGAAFRWYNTTGDFVGLVSSSTITGNPTFVLPASLGTAGQVMKTDGASGNLYFDAVATTTLAGFSTDGGGSAITAGSTNYLYIPQDGTITGWTLLADTTGSVVIDVKKCAGYNCDPVTSIAGSEKPTLTNVWANQDASLSSWTTALTAGDKLAFVIDSAATVTKLHLSITGYR